MKKRLILKFLILLMACVFLIGKPASAKDGQLEVHFIAMKSDSSYKFEIDEAVKRLLDFSKKNQLGINDSKDFIVASTVYGSKASFDHSIETSSGWKLGTKVPKSYVGYGENKEFFVISWPAYREIHPTDSRKDYEKLLTHEITHLFHSAYLKGDDDNMGPVWFYEGLACFVAGQYEDAAVPVDIGKTMNDSARGNYKDYVAIFRALAKKTSVVELLKRSQEKDLNQWAITLLR